MGIKSLFLKDEPKPEQPKVDSNGANSAPIDPQMFTDMLSL